MEEKNKKMGGISSIIVIAFSCVSVLLLVAYIGTSLGSKGTFSASEADGVSVNGYRCTYIPENGNRKIDFITYCDKYAIDSNGNELTCDTAEGRAANANTKCYHMDEGRVINVYDRCNVYDENNWRCQLAENFSGGWTCEKDTGRLAYIARCHKYGDSQSDTDGMCGVLNYMLYNKDELDFTNSCLVRGGSFVNAYNVDRYDVNGVNMCNKETGKVVKIFSCNYGSSNVVCYANRESQRHTQTASYIISHYGIPIENLVDVNDEACSNSAIDSSSSSSFIINPNPSSDSDFDSGSSYGYEPGTEPISYSSDYSEENFSCPSGLSLKTFNDKTGTKYFCCPSEFSNGIGTNRASSDSTEGYFFCVNANYHGENHINYWVYGSDDLVCESEHDYHLINYSGQVDCRNDGGSVQDILGGRSICTFPCGKMATNATLVSTPSSGSNSSSISGSGVWVGNDSDFPNCGFDYSKIESGKILLNKSNANCPCEIVSSAWSEKNGHNQCSYYLHATTDGNGSYYSKSGLKSCYTGYSQTVDGKSCVKCNSGYKYDSTNSQITCVLDGNESSAHTCKFTYVDDSDGKIWVSKNYSECLCEAINDSFEDSDYGLDSGDDENDPIYSREEDSLYWQEAVKNSKSYCTIEYYPHSEEEPNKMKYDPHKMNICYESSGFELVSKAGGWSYCYRCLAGYKLVRDSKYDFITNCVADSGSSSSGSSSSSNNSNVVAGSENSEAKQAASEVSKIVDDIVVGESISGVDDNLKAKITNAVENGKTIHVEVAKSGVNETNVSNDAAKVKDKISETQKVAAYYNVDVVVKVDDNTIGNITKLENKITVSVPIPAGLPSVKTGYNRQYKIIGVHDGIVDVITPQVSGSNLSFKTDKFSTYAVVYEDVQNNSGTTTTVKPTDNNVSDNPQTSTVGIIIAWIVGALAICYALYYFSLTNKSKD